MRKLLLVFAIGICQLSTLNCFAQAPNAIPYQGVARNASGNIIASQPVSLRISIHDGTAGGTVVYSETHNPATTALGLFSVNIGSGTVISGTLAAVNWGSGAKFLQVEMDATGGSSYNDMGTSQLNSVPYALYAGSSADNKWTVSGNDIYNNNTGNVGIGTSSPSAKLEVNGDAKINGVTVGKGAGNNGYNTVVGNAALNVNTTGIGNSAFGINSLTANTTGSNNTGLGLATLQSNTSGSSNTAAGLNALFSNTTGDNNTGLGFATLQSNTSGSSNTAAGLTALFSNTTGINNTGLGLATLHANTSGSNNTAVGLDALFSNTTGNNNTAIGNFADVSASNLTNATAIGYNAHVAASNSLVLGDNANVGIGTSAPVNKLDIEGGLAVGATYSGSNTAPTNGAIIEGKVGIGTATPQTPLHIVSSATNGQILFNGAQVDCKIGTDGVNDMWFDNATLTALNSKSISFKTAGVTKMIILGTGNVGIGTSAPVNKLDIEGGLAVGATYSGTTTAPTNGAIIEGKVGIGTSAPVNKLDIEGGLAVGATYSGSNAAPTNGAIIEGKVGIGTATPQTPLHIVSSATNGQILFNGAQVDCKIGTDGLNDMWLDNATLTAVAAKSISFKIAGNPKMTILGNGNVGIGQTSPQAPLHISGTGITAPSQGRTYFALNTSLNSDNSSSGNILIRADGWFWANGGGYIATSDKRIKKIIGATITQQDLETLASIKITNYKYIDEIRNGSKLQKKVIAQQLKEVYPDAVNQNAGLIPNVYETAQAVKVIGATTIISTRKKHDFKTGDIVKLVLEKGAEKELKVTVMDEHTFSIDEVINDNVFVYGKKVDDLLNVDYDAVSMLNVSATQELYKMVKELQEENRSLKKQNTEMKAVNEKLETRVSAIEKKINSLPVASQVAN